MPKLNNSFCSTKTGTRYRVMFLDEGMKHKLSLDVYLTVKVLLDDDKTRRICKDRERVYSFIYR